MEDRLSTELQSKVLSMPEFRYGAHKVVVTLANGVKYGSVIIAWGDEIIKCGSESSIPFRASEVVEVENDL